MTSVYGVRAAGITRDRIASAQHRPVEHADSGDVVQQSIRPWPPFWPPRLLPSAGVTVRPASTAGDQTQARSPLATPHPTPVLSETETAPAQASSAEKAELDASLYLAAIANMEEQGAEGGASVPGGPTPIVVLPPTNLLPTPTPARGGLPIVQSPVRHEQPVSEATVVAALTQPLQPPTEATPTPLAVPPVADGIMRTVRVPILMYHYLSDPPAGADIYRVDLSVSPAQFSAHLDAIQAEGYTTISLYDLVAHLRQGTALPEKPVILTFDDGYRDAYENALPILRDHDMRATFFVVTDFVDEERPAYVTWDMVREMHAAGMSIESHGRNHVSLRNKDRDYLIWQALGSLETIQHEIGVRPRFVSYPAGEYDTATIEIFQSANYWAGVTTMQGATHSNQELFQLQRVRIRNTTTSAELLRLLALDW